MSSPQPPVEQGKSPLDAAARELSYDRNIAPALADVARSCHAAGLSLVAAVEWDWGECGSTFSFQERIGPQLSNARAAIIGGLNADAIIGALMDYARQHGHSSILLKQLGVPLTPEGKATS